MMSNLVMIVFISLLGYCCVSLLIGVWIYKDACKRGGEPLLWVLVFLFSQGIGLVLYLLVGRQNSAVQCPGCNKRLQKEARYCMVCGTPLEGSMLSSKIEPDRQSKILMVVIIGIMLCSLIISVVFTLSQFTDKEYGFSRTTVFTGFYMTKGAQMSERQWQVEANTIMMDGKANATLDFTQGVPQSLMIQSVCDEGQLILHLEQDGLKQTVDINDITVYELRGFKTGKVKVSLEHKGIKNFQATINW
ncbi:MAG: hypothetical protein ACRCTE_04450 [Cellulosilyticaceae bacterium]